MWGSIWGLEIEQVVVTKELFLYHMLTVLQKLWVLYFFAHGNTFIAVLHGASAEAYF